MELVRWNPRNDFWGMHRRLNRMFDDLLVPATHRESNAHPLLSGVPAVDIVENENSIVIQAEMPGVDKKDIEIDVKDGVLTLKGERKADSETKEENYYRRERVYGSFQRVFTLPSEVNHEAIKADYKDGVLKIDIPKPEKTKPKKITIH